MGFLSVRMGACSARRSSRRTRCGRVSYAQSANGILHGGGGGGGGGGGRRLPLLLCLLYFFSILVLILFLSFLLLPSLLSFRTLTLTRPR